MLPHLSRDVHVKMGRDCVVGRRDFLRVVAASGVASAGLAWRDAMRLQAAELRRQGMACILLWMQGGPSQFETFSPKPGHANGGETKAISTSVPGIQISENFPQVAKVMQHVAVVRSMTSKEGSHPRATFLLHTGSLPTPSIKYPTFGSVALHELGDPQFELPGFVRIGGRQLASVGGGFLGVQYDPFLLTTAERPPVNSQPATDTPRFRRRLDLLGRLEEDFAAADGKQLVADHQKLYGKASRMILSPQMKLFDLDEEPATLRDAYGRTPFGSACLLSRRLVEEGVTFVEIELNGWDTHQDNFNRSRQLAGQVDQSISRLIADLVERGMLERTLVVWMGEFGRTPRINPNSGRDHYPRAFNVALAGGGIHGGQVVGETDAGGVEITDRPVTVPDLFRTFCKALGIDADRENRSPIGRPIKIVDGGQAVSELFS